MRWILTIIAAGDALRVDAHLKSRAYARIMSYSPKCPEIEGLNAG
jgi:hypothetical protein